MSRIDLEYFRLSKDYILLRLEGDYMITPLQGIFFLIICIVGPNLVYLLLGLFLSGTVRFHRIGIRLLAMSMLVSGRFIASRCRQFCRFAHCGNWTCEGFHHSK